MAKRDRSRSGRFVSRGGDKLESALEFFGVDVARAIVADLGANVGGFTDCLLQRGASKVYAIETGYGVLDWKLRSDERVLVMERQNALHVRLEEDCDVVVADVGWTPLDKVIPPALDLLNQNGCCLALLKPQYEARPHEVSDGHVENTVAEAIVDRVVDQLQDRGKVLGVMEPGVDRGGRNPERFVWIARRP